MVESVKPGRSGRRPGDSGAREAIAAAARHQFSESGFDRTTIRSIAASAKVDPGLVVHYFGSKQKLFAAVMELPFDPAEVVPKLVSGAPEQLGHRFAEFMIGMLETPQSRERICGIVRAAASEPEAALLVRKLITRQVLMPMVQNLGSDQPELRASLVGSQIVGLVMARYVVQVEPLASVPPAVVVAAMSPVLQHYLTANLDR